MDMKQEEMQFLGLFGIYKEAYNIILSWRKIYSQITLVLVLPLCFVFLIDAQVSLTLPKLTPTYWLFKAAHFTLLVIFSVLLTSVVAYTIASIHGGLEVRFKKVMAIIPKVWKRIMITALCTILAMILYIVVTFAFLHPLAIFLSSSGCFSVSKIHAVLTVFLMLGLVYLSVVWQLAGVVSVLEDAQGIEAMNKSMELTKGKMWMAFLLFSSFFVSSFLLQLTIKKLFERGLESFGLVAYGVVCFLLLWVLCFLLLITLILISHATQTVFYFVCKSYHQDIDVDYRPFLSHDDHHVVVDAEEEHVPLLKSNEDVQK